MLRLLGEIRSFGLGGADRSQIALGCYSLSADSILEVGAGESTTMSVVVQSLGSVVGSVYGFDVSWSRVAVGRQWLDDNGIRATTFVGDLFNIPMRSSSVDVVYSSHSLEPNGGRERDAIAECLRVAKFGVVLVEPLHELASPEAQARMQAHGYVRGLKAAAESLNVDVLEHNLLPFVSNPLNPSGVLVLKKRDVVPESDSRTDDVWQCPLTGAPLAVTSDCYWSHELGIAYPVFREVPMLRAEHAIVASRLEAEEALAQSRRQT